MQKIDRTGQRYGRLLVEKEVGGRPIRWVCRCDCGRRHVVQGTALTNGSTRSCGCLKRELAGKRHDLSGQRFGRLVVQRRSTERRWLCRCDCGAAKEVHGTLLRDGRAKSCGCLRREMGVARGLSSLRHGEARNGATTTEYRIWVGMIQRCTNRRGRQWDQYGGRGITVCRRWLESFEAFLEDMGRRPTPRHTLDRRNNDRGYSPENCRWADWSVQAANRRGARARVVLNGAARTVVEWARIRGLSYRLVNSRLVNGWTPLEALGAAPRKRQHQK